MTGIRNIAPIGHREPKAGRTSLPPSFSFSLATRADWIYPAHWPTPSSRLHKADVLEDVGNLTKRYNGCLLYVEVSVPDR